MNCAPTLTSEEFKILHNTLCDLDRIQDSRVQSLVERIRKEALKGAYAQDNSAFDRKWEHYHRVREEYGLQTTWSVYEVEDLFQQHAYPGAAYVIYDQHWGGGEVVRAIDGNTWVDLYRAADAAILASGDGHHTFIEAFEPVADKPHHLRLTTGS